MNQVMLSKLPATGASRLCAKVVALACSGLLAANAHAQDLGYLQGLLSSTPVGGWVKANTNLYSDAWATGAGALPPYSYTNPSTVIAAWSSFAWDSNSGNLLLWGGGHATYFGNEMYVWQGSNGQWTRGSLPSRVVQDLSAPDPRTYLVVDSAAPQSSHTYDNNVFLPLNNLFITFGGAAFNTGGNFEVSDGAGGRMRAGPWVWDPTKADPGKVGGTDGSGYDSSIAGGNMWTNLQGVSAGGQPVQFVQASTAYRQEGGKDVVYLTTEPGIYSSGWQDLYRYTVGDLRNGGTATWEKVGISWGAAASQGAATIDDQHGLYVRTTHIGGAADLAVWDLANSNPANPVLNKNRGVELVFADGSPFVMTTNFGIDYDDVNGTLVLWDNNDGGKVYVTQAAFDANGVFASKWVVQAVNSSTAAQPAAMSTTGVLGKWEYVEELGAFVALTGYSSATGDAEVWLYKTVPLSVPEPETFALFLAGLGVIIYRARRRLTVTADRR